MIYSVCFLETIVRRRFARSREMRRVSSQFFSWKAEGDAYSLFFSFFVISSDICSTIALLTVFEMKIEGIIGVVTCSGERSKISIDLDSISAHLLHEREGFRKG